MRRVLAAGLVAMIAAAGACSVGDGTGAVTGSLNVPLCKNDLSHYDLSPDFFGAVAYQDQLIIRIQHGGDLTEYTDTLVIQVDDVKLVQAAIDAAATAHQADPTKPTGADFNIVEYERLPGSNPNVAPVPVRLVMSLRKSCGTPKILPGTIPGSDPPNIAMEAVAGSIHFDSIFHGDVSSRDVDSKRIQGSFHVDLADPRQGPSTPANQKLSGHLDGAFKFIYEQGGPAQPFP